MSQNFRARNARSARSGRAMSGSRYSSSGRSRRAPKKAFIHHSKFVRPASPRELESFTPLHAFSDFAIAPLIQQNLTNMGFSEPSPIQDQAIPLGLAGHDVVGIANTGTGKTAAFAVPVLNALFADSSSRAIILAPTRELAQQIEDQCRAIGKGTKLTGALLIGGVSMGPQLRDLRAKPRIIVGTPGRVKDHLERGTLNISDCNLIVLDEVDRMLDMGFVDDITHILSLANPVRQSFYFSATLDARVTRIIESFSEAPTHISVKSADTSDFVDQNVIFYDTNTAKMDKLHDILISENVEKAIIFEETQRTVERLAEELAERGFQSDAIHGGKSQSQRDRVLQKFKKSHINVLVATDVAARGLDVADITHVINYAQPQSYDDYVHRIGRTGRAGKVGYALTFVKR